MKKIDKKTHGLGNVILPPKSFWATGSVQNNDPRACSKPNGQKKLIKISWFQERLVRLPVLENFGKNATEKPSLQTR